MNISRHCNDLIYLLDMTDKPILSLEDDCGEINWDIGSNDFDDIINYHMNLTDPEYARIPKADNSKQIENLLFVIESEFEEYLSIENDIPIDTVEDLKHTNVLIHSNRIDYLGNSGHKVVDIDEDVSDVRQALFNTYSNIDLFETNYHRILYARGSSHDVPTGSGILIISFKPEENA